MQIDVWDVGKGWARFGQTEPTNLPRQQSRTISSRPVQSSPPCQARLLPASELAVGEHPTHTIKSALGVDVLEEEEEEEESIVRRCMYL